MKHFQFDVLAIEQRVALGIGGIVCIAMATSALAVMPAISTLQSFNGTHAKQSQILANLQIQADEIAKLKKAPRIDERTQLQSLDSLTKEYLGVASSTKVNDRVFIVEFKEVKVENLSLWLEKLRTRTSTTISSASISIQEQRLTGTIRVPLYGIN